MLDKLIQQFKTLSKSFDILYVIENAKPVSRILLDEEKINMADSLLKEFNLKTILSDFKIAEEIDENRCFSDRGVKIDKKAIIPGRFFMYISKSESLARKAKEAEAVNNHIELGRLLGYPKCCSSFFEKNFPIESKKNNDYTLAALRNSNGFKFPFLTNISIRHMDLVLLSHFPCNFNCAGSIKIAEKNLNIIKRYSKKYYSVITDMLKGAVIYTENDGVFLLRCTGLVEDTLSYEKIITNSNNNIYSLLKNSSEIKISGSDSIKINDKELNNVGFMIFS